ncbi:MAG: Mor transcription activator family protein [Candidatus Thiodiazotropha taylori]
MTEINICDFIGQYLERRLSGIGVTDTQAQEVIGQLQRDIRAQYGGDRVYVPTDQKMTKQERDRAIIIEWKAKTDRNIIADHHGVHRSTVDRVISHYLNRTPKDQGFGRSEWNI